MPRKPGPKTKKRKKEHKRGDSDESSNEETVKMETMSAEVFDSDWSELLFDVVPDAKLGDIFTQKSDGSYELFILNCKGCLKEFRVDSSEGLQRFVHHCLRECDNYQILGIAQVCDICNRFCLDELTLLHHRSTSVGECAFSPRKKFPPSTSPSRTTTATSDVGSDYNAGKPSSISTGTSDGRVLDVITISENKRDDAPRLQGICYEFVPDELAGDMMEKWSRSLVIQSTVCRGCTQRFPTMETRDQVVFINHCLTECPEYMQLETHQQCHPCGLLCMDQQAFIEHILNSENCPAHPFLSLKHRNKNSSQIAHKGKESAKDKAKAHVPCEPDTIQLD